MNDRRLILDTSAYLALVHREPGHEEVARWLTEASGVMSAVNVAEVLTKQNQFGIPVEEALGLLQLTGIQVMEFGVEGALQASLLRPITQPLGLSLEDRACIALGMQLGSPVITADRVWDRLELGVKVYQIR